MGQAETVGMSSQRLARIERLLADTYVAKGLLPGAQVQVWRRGALAYETVLGQADTARGEALARDTHKFESRYLDGLVGPYPEARAVYLERSPINHVDQLAAPILLLQGTEDKVVPPAQAELMAAAMEIAATIASKSPVSTRMGKHTLNVIEDMSLRDGYRYEQDMTAAIGKTDDAREAQAAFREKRVPVFTGR